MEKINVVCGLNSSRSQIIEEFLRSKYSSNSDINIKSSGLDVYILREDDKRTLFTKEMARGADVILASDHDRFYRIRYNLLDNDERHIQKVHLLRIPDVFHTHKNAFLSNPKTPDYGTYIQKIRQEPEFKELAEYIKALGLKECSELLEAIYIKELYSAHLAPRLRQDKKYPSELLYKTLEFRFPSINKLICFAENSIK